MKRVAKFEKVSFEQFKKDYLASRINNVTVDEDEEIRKIYDSIELPKRSTRLSAGYDFYMPVTKVFNSGVEVLIPTGIKCKMEEGWVLGIYPRSGLGFKYKMRLNNTVGIIDGDYYDNKNNEGHIMVKMSIEKECELHKLNAGDAFCQGIFTEFGITEDDEADGTRVGGMGSTDK